MFNKDCPNKDIHEPHEFDHKWPGNLDGPVTYKCPGVEFTEKDRLDWERNNRAFFKATGGSLEPLGTPFTFGIKQDREYPLKLDFENGKYTLCLSEDGQVYALRYGEPWRHFVGDKFMYTLARNVFNLGENE
jgi:hypothetical protein